MIVINFFTIIIVEMMKPTPTVDEIISALRIVRKFSPQKNLIKEIEMLLRAACQQEITVNYIFLLYIRYKYTTTCTTLLLKRLYA